jgi:mannitol-specific phosphotransferase system IIBC component
MTFFFALWLPILVSAVVLFIASSIAWTVLTHHFHDHNKLPNEEEFMAQVRSMELPNATYIFPLYLSHKDAQNPDNVKRYNDGPRGVIMLWDVPNIGRNLGLTFLYFFIIATVTAYIGWASMGPGVGFLKAFQVIGAIGVLVFASSGQLNAIWFPRRTLNDFLDGVVFGVLMGLVFGLLWP